MKKRELILTILVFSLVLLVMVGCSANVQTMGIRTPLPEGTLSAEEFAKYYPKQYDSFLKNQEMSIEGTKYGGSEEYDNLTQWPFLKEIFAGYGFSKEYNEDRGHAYALEDVIKIKRINENSIASCWTCKSANVAGLVEEMGDAYYSTNFHELKPKITEGITCANCHDPQTMNLVITQPPLRDTLERLGKDPDNLTTQELRSYVCAQCHVEYYFAPENSKVTFPWDKGFEPEDVLAYYEEINFSDWEHPKSGTGVLKAQHPEFETFQGSIHQAAGLACADCHMPYIMVGGEKVSSHWWTSPLKHIEESCMTCHRENPDWLRERVFYIQDKTANLMKEVGNINVEAIHAIEAAASATVKPEALAEARSLHRKAQFLLDWVAAENSMGFHNPELIMETLTKSLNYATQAKLKAIEAQTGVAAPVWQPETPMTAENAIKAMQSKQVQGD